MSLPVILCLALDEAEPMLVPRGTISTSKTAARAARTAAGTAGGANTGYIEERSRKDVRGRPEKQEATNWFPERTAEAVGGGWHPGKPAPKVGFIVFPFNLGWKTLFHLSAVTVIFFCAWERSPQNMKLTSIPRGLDKILGKVAFFGPLCKKVEKTESAVVSEPNLPPFLQQ
jgi:hypothetical protein